MRELNKSTPTPTYDTFKEAIEHADPEICANAMITLIKICTYLLKQQIKQLEIAFVNEGGLRERMTRARIEQRKKGKLVVGIFWNTWDAVSRIPSVQKNLLTKPQTWRPMDLPKRNALG
ncbi:four helix bundle suffix domain-containing protein [Cyclobacterium plantarum]|uniref:four helix bundle suffix domain-containing protein n=1 Tax=Cyclobacterium plantarum TaxID=2716263 RepID=UPI001C9E8740|nr:four helix bundle suffix domain-containing protein [Cyclobacterium plantarum]